MDPREVDRLVMLGKARKRRRQSEIASSTGAPSVPAGEGQAVELVAPGPEESVSLGGSSTPKTPLEIAIPEARAPEMMIGVAIEERGVVEATSPGSMGPPADRTVPISGDTRRVVGEATAVFAPSIASSSHMATSVSLPLAEVMLPSEVENLRKAADFLGRFLTAGEGLSAGQSVEQNAGDALRILANASCCLVNFSDTALKHSPAELQMAKRRVEDLESLLEQERARSQEMAEQIAEQIGLCKAAERAALERALLSEDTAALTADRNARLVHTAADAEKSRALAEKEMEKLQRLLILKEAEVRKCKADTEQRANRAVNSCCRASFVAGFEQCRRMARERLPGRGLRSLQPNFQDGLLINAIATALTHLYGWAGTELTPAAQRGGARREAPAEGVLGRAEGGEGTSSGPRRNEAQTVTPAREEGSAEERAPAEDEPRPRGSASADKAPAV